MSLESLIKRPALTLSILSPLLLAGCGGDYNPALDGGVPGSSGAKTGLQLSVPLQPTVAWMPGNQTTQLIMQFSVRDGSGTPLAANEFDTELRIDGFPADVESQFKQTSEELPVNLYFGMVLDASYSMTQYNPDAFGPMKRAASDSYQQVLDLWKSRPGSNVKFSLIWFDNVINQSQDVPSVPRYWQPADILAIPTPQFGAATKLYSAVDVMAKHMQNEYDNGVFNGVRDQYVMLVFSDGKDNRSHTDNSTINQTLYTNPGGAKYNQFGTLPTKLETVKQSIANHPRLTTHVIGLGSDINKDELQQIATAGHGVFQSNPSSEKVTELFQQVMKEFTTLQTRSAELFDGLGDYKITLVVTNKATGETGQYNFMIRAGGPDAKVITAPL